MMTIPKAFNKNVAKIFISFLRESISERSLTSQQLSVSIKAWMTIFYVVIFQNPSFDSSFNGLEEIRLNWWSLKWDENM